ncbi:hypothetical protein V5O48_009282 [Marasmius crinis-equi]|uniref:Uncharacterized protein n=1 Tax=Marasmius crinis-equi TaxID=585013 RepID=A0ABR3FBQ7_9AGAR
MTTAGTSSTKLKKATKAHSETLVKIEVSDANSAPVATPINMDGAPSIEDNGIIFLGSPLPQWAKDKAIIQALALGAKKPN